MDCSVDGLCCHVIAQFIHGGHTDKVAEFAWSESDDWVIASVAEDNVLQIWQMVRVPICGYG